MVTDLAWIPRGVTPPVLGKAQTTEEAMQRYMEIIQTPSTDEKNETPEFPVTPEDAEIIARYHMDTYDQEEEPDGIPNDIIVNDEYQTGPITEDPVDEDETIQSTDHLLIVGKPNDEVPTLEIYVYDEDSKQIFVHHEVMLPAYPLCIRWIATEPFTGNQGSFAAVSSMRKEIEIWNLNIEDEICPAAVLQFHTDSVLGLSWNLLQPKTLVSASIDQKAAIWSLDTCQVIANFDVGAKCHSVEWSPREPTSFLVGAEGLTSGFDVRSGKVFDALQGESVECLSWSKDGQQFLAGMDQGQLIVYDIRNMNAPMMNFQAHNGPLNSLAICKSHPNVVVTAGDDCACKLWDLSSVPEAPFAQEEFEGSLITCSFCPDTPTLLAIGGDNIDAVVWDIENLVRDMPA